MRWSLDTDRPLDLWGVVVLTLLLDLVVLAFPESPLRVVLGLPFVLFLPGYALVAALFPERHREYVVEKGPEGLTEEEVSEGIDGLERVALSFGLSIAVVPLVGLALNYTPWGIRLVPILLALSVFNLVMAGVAWGRRRALPREERLVFHVDVAATPWGERSRVDQVLTVGLALSIVAATGTLAYVLWNPRPGEAFTEFYVLGPGGKAEGYPQDVPAGGNASGILGVRNHEHRPVDYVVEAWLVNQSRTGENATVHGLWFLERWRVTLPSLPTRIEAGEPYEPQWEQPWNLTLDRPGEWKLRFVLYGDGLGEEVELAPSLEEDRDYAGTAVAERVDSAYRSLHLWVTVRR